MKKMKWRSGLNELLLDQLVTHSLSSSPSGHLMGHRGV